MRFERGSDLVTPKDQIEGMENGAAALTHITDVSFMQVQVKPTFHINA